MPVVSGWPHATHWTGARRRAARLPQIGSMPTSGYSRTCGLVCPIRRFARRRYRGPDLARNDRTDGWRERSRRRWHGRYESRSPRKRPRSISVSQPSRNSRKIVWSWKKPLTIPSRMRSPGFGGKPAAAISAPPAAGTSTRRTRLAVRDRSSPWITAERTAVTCRSRRPCAVATAGSATAVRSPSNAAR